MDFTSGPTVASIIYSDNFKICGGRPTQDPNRGSMRHLFKSVCFSSGYLLPALQPASLFGCPRI